MAIETTGDRLEYLTEFGEDVTFHTGATNWDSTGIFGNAFVESLGVESQSPSLLCRLDDIYQPGQLQNIEYRATSVILVEGGYNIVEVQDDGVGMVTLILELQ